MSDDPEATRYYLRATDPTNNEQIAFECVGLAVANAKAAELRMGRWIPSVAIANGASSRPGKRAAQQDRRVRLLRRLGPCLHRRNLDDLAVVVGRLLGPDLL